MPSPKQIWRRPATRCTRHLTMDRPCTSIRSVARLRAFWHSWQGTRQHVRSSGPTCAAGSVGAAVAAGFSGLFSSFSTSCCLGTSLRLRTRLWPLAPVFSPCSCGPTPARPYRATTGLSAAARSDWPGGPHLGRWPPRYPHWLAFSTCTLPLQDYAIGSSSRPWSLPYARLGSAHPPPLPPWPRVSAQAGCLCAAHPPTQPWLPRTGLPLPCQPRRLRISPTAPFAAPRELGPLLRSQA